MELLVVLAIIGILSAVAIPVYADHLDKVRTAACAAQREEIYRVFVVESLTNEEVGECKDTVELQHLLGKDPIEYLADQGYFKLEEMRCPVYDEQYKLDVSTINGVKSVQVVCSCVANENSFIAFAQKTYEEIKYNGMGREKLIKEVYDSKGSLLEVSERMKSGTAFEKEDLYWRPYFLADGKMILYAAPGNNDSHVQWRASLLYVDGQVYQSTLIDKNSKPQGTVISKLYEVNGDELTSWLEGETFSKR